MRLEGKVAIITGAAAGIGRAASVMFAREGATVAVTDINDQAGEATVEEIRSAGGKARYWHCDVSRGNEVKSMIPGRSRALWLDRRLVQQRGVSEGIRFGNRDGRRPVGPRYSDLAYGRLPVLQVFDPAHGGGGGGSIISTASVGGVVTFKGNAPYCTAKAGLIMLMKSIAADYGHQGIRANSIAPGAIDTQINEQYKDDLEVQANWERKSLIGRPLGRPEEVAAAAVFLASDESSFVTAAVLPVDGGWLAT